MEGTLRIWVMERVLAEHIGKGVYVHREYRSNPAEESSRWAVSVACGVLAGTCETQEEARAAARRLAALSDWSSASLIEAHRLVILHRKALKAMFPMARRTATRGKKRAPARS